MQGYEQLRGGGENDEQQQLGGAVEIDGAAHPLPQVVDQQRYPRRFKIIDFGHAELEPVQGGSPGLAETK